MSEVEIELAVEGSGAARAASSVPGVGSVQEKSAGTLIVRGSAPTLDVVAAIERAGGRARVVGVGRGWPDGSAVSQFLGAFTPAIRGLVRFTQVADQKTVVEVDLDGLSPGEHALAVHESGDLSRGCESTGRHFNPAGHAHGARTEKRKHAGDLGNVLADDMGRIRTRFEVESLVISDIIGRSVCLYAGPDDEGRGGNPNSTVDGNAGMRLECGIVARAASISENVKRICTCDGTPIWEAGESGLESKKKEEKKNESVKTNSGSAKPVIAPSPARL